MLNDFGFDLWTNKMLTGFLKLKYGKHELKEENCSKKLKLSKM